MTDECHDSPRLQRPPQLLRPLTRLDSNLAFARRMRRIAADPQVLLQCVLANSYRSVIELPTTALSSSIGLYVNFLKHSTRVRSQRLRYATKRRLLGRSHRTPQVICASTFARSCAPLRLV